MARVVQEINTIVDHQTGEVFTTHKEVKIKSKNADEFYMVFVRFMSPVFKIKSITDMHVLGKMCSLMEFNSNKVFLPAGRRKTICDELDILPSNLSRSITKLKELGLIKGDSGTYEINPIVYWKGTTSERAKLLKDKTIQVTFTDADDALDILSIKDSKLNHENNNV